MIAPAAHDMNHFSTAPLQRNRRSSLDKLVLDFDCSFELDLDASLSNLDLDSSMTKLDLNSSVATMNFEVACGAFEEEEDLQTKNTPAQEKHHKQQSPEKTPLIHCPLSLLHRTCQGFPTNKEVIKTALVMDEEGVKRQVADLPLLPTSAVATASDGKIWWKSAPKTQASDFQYPINIAINNGATAEVVELLANAAPEILLKPDGVQGLTTPQIALQKQPTNLKLIQVLFQANFMAAYMLTKRKDTLLHTACQKGCPLSLVKALSHAHPGALKQKNFHGETPKQVAGRTLTCPDDVVDYLQRHP